MHRGLPHPLDWEADAAGPHGPRRSSWTAGHAGHPVHTPSAGGLVLPATDDSSFCFFLKPSVFCGSRLKEMSLGKEKGIPVH